jgi:hypothetical protein
MNLNHARLPIPPLRQHLTKEEPYYNGALIKFKSICPDSFGKSLLSIVRFKKNKIESTTPLILLLGGDASIGSG